MNVEIARTEDYVARITTEHSRSSYGIPVLVYEGIADPDYNAVYGPGDAFHQSVRAEPVLAGDMIRSQLDYPQLLKPEVAAAMRRFLGE